MNRVPTAGLNGLYLNYLVMIATDNFSPWRDTEYAAALLALLGHALGARIFGHLQDLSETTG